MSVIDRKMRWSWDQALTSVGTTVSTDIFKVQGAGVDPWGNAVVADIGEAGKLWINVMVTTSFTTASAQYGKLQIHLQGSPSATAGSFVTVRELMPATNMASLTTSTTAGTEGSALVRMPWPADLDAATYDHWRLLYTISGTPFNAGAVSAWTGMDSETPH